MLIAEAVQDSETRTDLRHSWQLICNLCSSSLFSALKIGVDVCLYICRHMYNCDIGQKHVLVLNIFAKSGYSSGLNIEKRAQYMEDVGACVHI